MRGNGEFGMGGQPINGKGVVLFLHAGHVKEDLLDMTSLPKS